MAIKIFFCYAHKDEELLIKLKAHLKLLQRQELIDVWHDRDIRAGTEWMKEISKQLNEADVILLLISSDFMNSDYCYSIEMKRAMERHERGEAYVIPIILRHVSWKDAPFAKLQVLPVDAKPIVSSAWHNIDEALLTVTESLEKLVNELKQRYSAKRPYSLALQHTLSPPPHVSKPDESTDEVFRLGYLAAGGTSKGSISNVRIEHNEAGQVVRFMYDES